jgi:hypothetical protein
MLAKTNSSHTLLLLKQNDFFRIIIYSALLPKREMVNLSESVSITQLSAFYKLLDSTDFTSDMPHERQTH